MSLSARMQRTTLQLLLLTVFLVSSIEGRAQITIGFQGGEPGDTWMYSSTGASTLALSEATQAPNKVTGTKSLVVGGNTGGGNCFDTGSGNGPSVDRTFTFDPLDISNCNQFNRALTFSWGNRYPTCTGTGWDSNEDLIFQAFYDGVGQGQVTIQSGNNNAGFSIQTHSYTHTIPPCVEEFYFIIFVNTNRADELLFIDDVKVTTPQLNAPLAQPVFIAGSTVVCAGNTETYTVTDFPGINHTWSDLPVGATYSGIFGNPSVDVNWGSVPPGIYTITVTPYDGCGNAGPPQSIDVQVVDNGPLPTIAGPVSMCQGETIVLTSSAPNGNTWSTGETTQSISVTSPGTYSVSVTGSCGAQTTSLTVNQNPGPNITDILVDDVTCFGDQNGSITVISSESNLSYSLDGQNWQGSNVFNGLSPGNYTVFLESASGCTSSGTAVVNEPDEVFAQISTIGPFCMGDPIALSGQTNTIGTASYSWTGPNAFTSNQQNPTNAVDAGTYVLIVTVDNCTGTGSVTIDLHEKPNPVFTASVACFGTETAFSSLGSSVPVPEQLDIWNWSFENGATSTDPDPTYSFASSGTHSVTLELTTVYGCSASLTQNVTVLPTPVANFQFSPAIISVSDPEVTFTNTSQNGDSFLWIFEEGGSSSTEISPTYTYPQTEGSYIVTLVAYNSSGCQDSVQKMITIGEGLIYYVPNSFTPNGDGFNEVFQPVFTSGFDEANFELSIFNRWGELVFSSKNATEGWNGKYENEPVPDGTYVWNIRFKHLKDDAFEQIQGHVSVFR